MVTKRYALALGFALAALTSAPLLAQNVGVGISTPDASAKLDIVDANRGLLIPRVNLTNVTVAAPVTAPANSLLVFNTNAAVAGGSGVGFYYWSTPLNRWVKLTSANEPWLLTGNAGTNPAINFLGTLDGQPVVFRTNNAERMRILAGGQVSVNNPAPFAVDVFSSYAYGANWAINGIAENGAALYAEVNGTGIGLDVTQNTTAGGRGVQVAMTSATSTDLAISAFHSGRGRALNLQQSNAANVEPVMFATTNGNARTVNAQNSLTTSTTQVGYFSQASTGTNPATFGNAAAVWGQSAGIRGGVFVSQAISDESTSLMGIINGAGFVDAVGVLGQATPGPGWGYGVIGRGNWFGVFANGDMGASGIKAFHIDHPQDPENKYLRHFSMESDEVLNVYRGNVTLDANGEATVQLPSYFGAINIDFSYHLTPIGAAANLFVKEEINAQNGTFKVAGGQPGQKVSWMVQAQRNDPYVQQNPAKLQVEIPKRPHEVNKYLMPELYNQPENKGIHYKDIKPLPAADPAPAPAPKDRGERVRE